MYFSGESLICLFSKKETKEGDFMEYTTTERRMEIVRILYSNDIYTIENLAFRLGVSARTIRRDIAAVSIRIPIGAKYGRNGGIFVRKSNKLDRLYMTKEEIDLLSKVLAKAVNCESYILSTQEIKTLEFLIMFYTPN